MIYPNAENKLVNAENVQDVFTSPILSVHPLLRYEIPEDLGL